MSAATEMHEAFRIMTETSPIDHVLNECVQIRGDIARLADVLAVTRRDVTTVMREVSSLKDDLREIKTIALQLLKGA